MRTLLQDVLLIGAAAMVSLGLLASAPIALFIGTALAGMVLITTGSGAAQSLAALIVAGALVLINTSPAEDTSIIITRGMEEMTDEG